MRQNDHARKSHPRVLSDIKENLTFPKAKSVDTNEVPGSPFFLDIKGFFVVLSNVGIHSHQPFTAIQSQTRRKMSRESHGSNR